MNRGFGAEARDPCKLAMHRESTLAACGLSRPVIGEKALLDASPVAMKSDSLMPPHLKYARTSSGEGKGTRSRSAPFSIADASDLVLSTTCRPRRRLCLLFLTKDCQ